METSMKFESNSYVYVHENHYKTLFAMSASLFTPQCVIDIPYTLYLQKRMRLLRIFC